MSPSPPWFAFRARRDEARAREAEEFRIDVERRVDRARLLYSEGGVEDLVRLIAPGAGLADVSVADAVRSVAFEVVRLRARVAELEGRSP